MVVILILGSSATPSTSPNRQTSLVSPKVSFDTSLGPPLAYHQRHYCRSISDNPTNCNSNGFRYQNPPQDLGTIFSRTKYKSVSVPQLSLGQRRHINLVNNRKSHPSPTQPTTKANHPGISNRGDETPLIRHITRVNICDASSQLDVAANNNGAITDAEPVTREGKYQQRAIILIIL